MEKIWRAKIEAYYELRSRALEIACLLSIGNESSNYLDFGFSEDSVGCFWEESEGYGEYTSHEAEFPIEYLWLSDEEIRAKRS